MTILKLIESRIWDIISKNYTRPSNIYKKIKFRNDKTQTIYNIKSNISNNLFLYKKC